MVSTSMFGAFKGHMFPKVGNPLVIDIFIATADVKHKTAV